MTLDLYENQSDDTFCCVYNDKSIPLLVKAKENADGYAISAIAKLMHDSLKQNCILKKIDIIIPVPPRKAAIKQRGYSFPVLLAKELAQLSGKKCLPKALVLEREISEQKGLSAVQRAENLQDAFAAGNTLRSVPHKRNILIIDDVSTTGATLNEARRALSEYAENVYIAAFAKTMIDN
jgi:predicted amidophosphoribosyltransferase